MMIFISSSSGVRNQYQYYKLCEKSILHTHALWQAHSKSVTETSWYSLHLHSWRGL